MVAEDQSLARSRFIVLPAGVMSSFNEVRSFFRIMSILPWTNLCVTKSFISRTERHGCTLGFYYTWTGEACKAYIVPNYKNEAPPTVFAKVFPVLSF